MQSTTNYSMNLVEGTDIVNIPVQINPNFTTIDSEMYKNKQASIGTATEVVTGTAHAIVRSNPDSDIFRFTATGAWTAGDTMSVDGSSVTVHLADGTTPPTGAYVIGAEVVAAINSSLVTLMIGAPLSGGVSSFNGRTGAVTPTAGDYVAGDIDYDNTGSGLVSTEVQSAIDELAAMTGLNIKWANPDPTQDFGPQNMYLSDADYSFLTFVYAPNKNSTNAAYSVRIPKGYATTLNYVLATGSGVRAFTRPITRTNDTTFNALAGSYATGTSADVTDNSVVVPLYVYGE